MTEKLGLLAVGHGSKLPYNKQVITEITDMIAKKHDVIVRTGFMEHSEPSVQEALQSFEGTGVTKIAVVPALLAAGVHSTEDIPEILNIDPETKTGIAEIEGREIPLLYGNPIGSDELLADIIFKRATEAI
jgi:sirohydrochlorin cobaltochelatase